MQCNAADGLFTKPSKFLDKTLTRFVYSLCFRERGRETFLAKKVKISKKKISKESDEFISTTSKVLNYAFENKKKFLVVTVAVLVLALLFTGWRFYIQKTEKDASALYYKAIRYYHGDNKTESSAKDDKERDNLALNKFKDIIDKYPRTSVARMAFLYSGHIYYKLDEFDKSIKSYQNFLKKIPSDNPLNVFAYDGLGYAFEAKGDYKNALIYFRKLIDGDEKPLSKPGYFNVGRCYEELGEKDKAIETYQRLASTYPNSGYTALAKEKINILKR
jgi:tetratricopeptide (TPR) repeat protein